MTLRPAVAEIERRGQQARTCTWCRSVRPSCQIHIAANGVRAFFCSSSCAEFHRQAEARKP